jgi:ATP phosphoribosyltransferase regulatory subunit
LRISAALPTGVTALLFEAARDRRVLEEGLVGSLEAAGYSEVILPIVDYLDPYEPFLSTAARGELYRLIDRDGELLALRADFTPLLARLLAPRLPALSLPLRLYYRGDVVRYQEERAGREREFYQVGAELLGVPGDAGEAEILRLFVGALAAGRARPVRVVLGFAGALDRFYRESIEPAALAGAVYRRERGSRLPRALREVIADGVPADSGALGPEAADRLARLSELALELAGAFTGVEVAVDLAEFAQVSSDPALAAQLGDRAYYDGVVFRGYAGPRGIPVGGGGRYDRLFSALGSPVPAVGFSLGLDRLLSGRTGGGE